jgi:hypothetical protein
MTWRNSRYEGRRKRMTRQAFGLGLLVTLVVLALSACGGGGDGAVTKEAGRRSRAQEIVSSAR